MIGWFKRKLQHRTLQSFLQEPGEAANKHLRKWQLDHSSQKGHKDRNLGVYHRLLERSDPVILRDMNRNSNNRKKFSSGANSLPIPPEVLALCKGQLISKGIFGVFRSIKKPPKCLQASKLDQIKKINVLNYFWLALL